MHMKNAFGILAALLIAVPISGCGTGQMVQTAYGPMPDYCLSNNTAAGAVIGSLLGVALGAAAGGGNGAALGAAIGGGAGGLAGAQVDAQCRQIAAQRAMERALAQHAAIIAQQVATSRYEPIAINEQPIPYLASNRHRHGVSVTQLNSYADPATKRTCVTGTTTDSDVDGKSSALIPTPTMCRGPGGQWVPA